MESAPNTEKSEIDNADEANGAAAERPKVRRDESSSVDDFSNPVYKKLSKINGGINKLTKDELVLKLREYKLETKGVKDVLKKRLKNFYKRRKLMMARIQPSRGTKFDYLVVIDFEATCEKNNRDYEHEIIEFPAHLVDVSEMKIVDSFHHYCKPVINPTLTDFCHELTGITQTQVDESSLFKVVLEKFADWMSTHQLGTENTYAILTDGPWDMSRFLHMQCEHIDLPFPDWGLRWINIRKAYSNFYHTRRCGIEMMLINLGLTFEGKLHCGLHDAKNIARIALRLLADGATLSVNEYLELPSDDEKEETCAESRADGSSDEDVERALRKDRGAGDVCAMTSLLTLSDNSERDDDNDNGDCL